MSNNFCSYLCDFFFYSLYVPVSFHSFFFSNKTYTYTCTHSLSLSFSHQDLCDEAVLRPLRRFKIGQFVSARIEEIAAPVKVVGDDDDDDDDDMGSNSNDRKNEYFVSLRASRTQASGDSIVRSDSLAPLFPVLRSFSDLHENALLVGFVKAASVRGVYVWLGRRVQAFVRVADLSDGFIKDPAQVRYLLALIDDMFRVVYNHDLLLSRCYCRRFRLANWC